MHMLLFYSWFLFEYAYPIKISTPRPCKKFQQWNLWSFERFMDCICKWLVLFFDCALDGDKACLHDKMDEIWTRFSPRHCESFDVTFGQSDYNHRFCLGILLKWRCGCFRWKYAENAVTSTHDAALFESLHHHICKWICPQLRRVSAAIFQRIITFEW